MLSCLLARCLVCLCLLAGCGSVARGLSSAGAVGAKGENPRCADPAPGTVCSINEAACQQRIWRALARVYPQLVGDPPPIALVQDPDSEADATAAAAAAEDAPSPFDDDRSSEVLAALGVPPDALARAGYYDGQRVVVDDEAVSSDSDQAMVTWMYVLAHEMTHAVQRANNRFDAYQYATPLMARTVIEGEAELYAVLTLQQLGFGVALDQTLGSSETRLKALLAESVGKATAAFPYIVGLRLMVEAHQRAGWPAVEELAYNPPSSYAALYGAEFPWSPEPRVRCTSRDPETTEVRLGAWHVVVLLQSIGADAPLAIGRAWRGGQAFLQTTSSADDTVKPITALWRLRWPEAWSAGQVEALIERAFADTDGRRIVQRDGADVIVSGTTGEPHWASAFPVDCSM